MGEIVKASPIGTGSRFYEEHDTGESCPECGQPLKMCIIRLPGVAERQSSVPCRCQEEKRRAAEEAEERKLACERRLQRLRSESGLTAAQQRITFDGWNPRPGADLAYRTAQKYVAAFQKFLLPGGVGMYLHGPTGSGKTRLACAVANSLINELHSVVYWNTPSLLEALKATFDGEGTEAQIMEAAHDCDLLILDDLGSERPTEWVRGILYELINSRIDAGLPTIITSNFAPETPELAREEMLGARIMSRLNDREIFPPISNTATDYRKEHGHVLE